MTDPDDRLRARVDRLRRLKTTNNPETGCWEWNGVRTPAGYGTVSVSGTRSSTTAHRLFFEAYVQRIPTGETVHHTCHNRGCVNPEHLQLATQIDNILDSHQRSALTESRDRAEELIDAMEDFYADFHRQEME